MLPFFRFLTWLFAIPAGVFAVLSVLVMIDPHADSDTRLGMVMFLAMCAFPAAVFRRQVNTLLRGEHVRVLCTPLAQFWVDEVAKKLELSKVRVELAVDRLIAAKLLPHVFHLPSNSYVLSARIGELESLTHCPNCQAPLPARKRLDESGRCPYCNA